jgi:diadenosine tetraphosphate (Ap4A) HIT family hydrolase
MSEGCVFCDQSWTRAAEIFIETPYCIFASTRDPDIRARAGLAEGVLPGSGVIVPITHRTSVFELTPAEWADVQDLLLRARMAPHDLLAPDGWNQGGSLHPHMHVIPRFGDEPLSDRWLRSAIDVPENRRPDPWAPGSGRFGAPGERAAASADQAAPALIARQDKLASELDIGSHTQSRPRMADHHDRAARPAASGPGRHRHCDIRAGLPNSRGSLTRSRASARGIRTSGGMTFGDPRRPGLNHPKPLARRSPRPLLAQPPLALPAPLASPARAAWRR